MKILKQILINSTTTIVTILIIGSAYAAISTVSSGDPLTADSWNQIVNKFDGIGENSVKEYVDATVSANSGGGYPVTNGISNRSSNSMTFPGTITYCKNLSEGGYTDWRLPTADELIQYVGTSTSTTDILWTSSITHRTINEFIGMNINDGSYNDYLGTTNIYVRCVR